MESFDAHKAINMFGGLELTLGNIKYKVGFMYSIHAFSTHFSLLHISVFMIVSQKDSGYMFAILLTPF